MKTSNHVPSLHRIVSRSNRWARVQSLCLLLCVLPRLQPTIAADSCLGGNSPQRFAAGSPSGCGHNPYPILGVGKYAVFQQTVSGSADLTGAHYVAAVSQGTRDAAKAITTVESASVTTPVCDSSHGWLQRADTQIGASTREELDRLAPPGKYQLALRAGGRFSHAEFTMPQTPWPTTPLLENFGEAQNIDPAKDFVIKLRADVGSVRTRILIFPMTPNAGIFIFDPPCDSPSLDKWVIPALSFAPSARYQLSIVSSRDLGLVNQDGAPGLSLVCVSVTHVVIQTGEGSISAPSITSQPSDVSCKIDQKATFSVVAAGTKPLKYQWFKDGVRIRGATSRSYTIQKARQSDQGKYSVVVTGGGGKTISNEAFLKVWVPPAIVTQPRSQRIRIGSNATFTVRVSGTSPLTFQWYKNNRPIDGATNATYVLRDVKVEDKGAYSVRVRNRVGTVVSRRATLSVQR